MSNPLNMILLSTRRTLPGRCAEAVAPSHPYPPHLPPTHPLRPQASHARADASHVLYMYAKRYMHRSISHSLHLCSPPVYSLSVYSSTSTSSTMPSNLGGGGWSPLPPRGRGRCGAVGGLRIFQSGAHRKACLRGWKRRVGGV